MTALTDKTRAVLVELFKQPDQERPARDVARAAGVQANVAGNLLGRLIAAGYVVDRRAEDGTRLFRVNPARISEAADVAGVTLKPAAAPPRAAVSAPQSLPPGVTTVGQLRAAYARGEVSQELLAQVERAVAETVKAPRTTTRTR